MAIVDEWRLSKDDTWNAFLTWYGLTVGQLRDEELLEEACHPQRVEETRTMALTELWRRTILDSDEPPPEMVDTIRKVVEEWRAAHPPAAEVASQGGDLNCLRIC